MGGMAWHGPHHSALKSTSMGLPDWSRSLNADMAIEFGTNIITSYAR